MYSLEVLEKLIKLDESEGLLDETTPYSFQGCQHQERLKLLNDTANWISQAFKLYEKSKRDLADLDLAGFPPIILTHIRNRSFSGIDQFSRTSQELYMKGMLCKPCVDRRKAKHNHPAVDHAGQGLVEKRPRRRERGDVRDDEDEGGRESGDLSEGRDESTVDPRRELLELAQRLGGVVVTARKDGIRRSKLVQPYQFQEERTEMVAKPFDPEFDEYKTGPTAEEVVDLYKEICAWFQMDPNFASWSTVTARFSDHGYRRTAGGFHQFYLNAPLVEDQLQHFFPLPPKDVLDDWKQRKEMADVDPEELCIGKWKGSIPAREFRGRDLEVWTLEEMVWKRGGQTGSDQWMKTYITGRADSESFIRLDIHKSRKPVEYLDFSADVDSVLWVTDRLKSAGAINLQLLPYKEPKAPIRTHNHAYVELCWPRTELEYNLGVRSDAYQWVPISNLPNTHFAHYGRTEGAAEVYVVFPRMRHKYPLRKVWETKVPYEVETFWLEKLVYPALRRLEEPGVKPYTNVDLGDILYKHRGSKEKTILLSPSQLETVQDGIHNILNEHKEDKLYTRFRSLFFVLQVLGIKVSTSTGDDWPKLWERLVAEHSQLDWKYMENTDNGELLVDIGFGIHPPEDSHLVGFWDTEAIRQGFDYGGYLSGVTHPVCTVPAIGGMHAEMSNNRRRRSHISYRLTYNLAYEVLRGQRTRLKESFFPLESAYQVDQNYLQSIKGVVDAYDRNKHKSFGVRDEYRCRASTMQRLLPLLKEKVRPFPQPIEECGDSKALPT